MTEKEMNLNILQPCCDEWKRAHQPGTDNEAYGSILGTNDDGVTTGTGCDDFIVNFCPFCGDKKNLDDTKKAVDVFAESMEAMMACSGKSVKVERLDSGKHYFEELTIKRTIRDGKSCFDFEVA